MNYGTLPHELPVDVDIATASIWNDPFMDNTQKAKLSGVFERARVGNNKLVTQNDIAKGLAYAGLGYAGSEFAGKVLGSMFGISAGAQSTLSNMGATYAGMKGLGII